MKNRLYILTGIVLNSIGFILLLVAFSELMDTPYFFRGIMMGLVCLVFGLYFSINSYRLPHSRFIRNRYHVRQLATFIISFLIFGLIALLLILNNPSEDMIKHMGFAAVCMGFGYWAMLSQINKVTKHSKLQEGLFEQSLFHENKTFFSMIVDEYEWNDKKMFLHGIVHGTVSKSDTIYFYFPSQRTFKSKVYAIKVNQVMTNVASNEKATIVIKCKKEIELPFYSVLSSAIPYKNGNLETPTTNPHVLALLNGYTEQKQNGTFYNYLMDSIVHGHYLIVVDRSKPGQGWMEKIYDYFFGYNGVYRCRTVVNSQGKESLAIYTDWQQVSLSREPHTKIEEALVMSFDDIQKYLKSQNGLDIVINPFSEYHFYMPEDMIQEVVTSSAYQERVVNKHKEDR